MVRRILAGGPPHDSGEPGTVVLYSRPDCHLCDLAKAALAPLLAGTGLRLIERDVETREEWRRRWGGQVPVAFLHGVKLFKYRVDPERVARRLRAAAADLAEGSR